MDLIEVLEQLLEAQPRVRDEVVEALHHLGLAEDGERG
jgi:hypothetical protein